MPGYVSPGNAGPISTVFTVRKGEQPHTTDPGDTMHWNDPDGGSVGDWVLPVGVGAGVGILGALGAGYYTSNAGRSFRANPRAVVAAGVAGLMVGTAATWGIRELNEREPGMPNPKDAPVAIKAVTPPGAPGDQEPLGSRAGNAHGSYQELESYQTYRTESYTDANGNHQTRTVSETHYRYVTRYFSHDYDLMKQRGRMDGYDTLDEALRDLNGDGQTAVLKRGDRYRLYQVDESSHWGDIHSMYISNPEVVAMVSPSGRVWSPGSVRWGGNFYEGGALTARNPVGDLYGDDIGRFAMIRRTDPDIRLYGNIGPGTGYEDAESAVGDAAARPGTQAVIARGGRHYVLEAGVGLPEANAQLVGIRTGDAAGAVEALEIADQQFAPQGDWWVRTRDPQ